MEPGAEACLEPRELGGRGPRAPICKEGKKGKLELAQWRNRRERRTWNQEAGERQTERRQRRELKRQRQWRYALFQMS